MAESEEFLGREISIHKLVSEKHGNDRRNGEGNIQSEPLPFVKSQCSFAKETKTRWQPCSPDEKFEKHHDTEFYEHGPLHRDFLHGIVNLASLSLEDDAVDSEEGQVIRRIRWFCWLEARDLFRADWTRT